MISKLYSWFIHKITAYFYPIPTILTNPMYKRNIEEPYINNIISDIVAQPPETKTLPVTRRINPNDHIIDTFRNLPKIKNQNFIDIFNVPPSRINPFGKIEHFSTFYQVTVNQNPVPEPYLTYQNVADYLTQITSHLPHLTALFNKLSNVTQIIFKELAKGPERVNSDKLLVAMQNSREIIKLANIHAEALKNTYKYFFFRWPGFHNHILYTPTNLNYFLSLRATAAVKLSLAEYLLTFYPCLISFGQGCILFEQQLEHLLKTLPNKIAAADSPAVTPFLDLVAASLGADIASLLRNVAMRRSSLVQVYDSLPETEGLATILRIIELNQDHLYKNKYTILNTDTIFLWQPNYHRLFQHPNELFQSAFQAMQNANPNPNVNDSPQTVPLLTEAVDTILAPLISVVTEMGIYPTVIFSSLAIGCIVITAVKASIVN